MGHSVIPSVTSSVTQCDVNSHQRFNLIAIMLPSDSTQLDMTIRSGFQLGPSVAARNLTHSKG